MFCIGKRQEAKLFISHFHKSRLYVLGDILHLADINIPQKRSVVFRIHFQGIKPVIVKNDADIFLLIGYND